MIKVTKEVLRKIYKPRPHSAHKYDYGLLLVIGGGEFYTGSPTLAALAAFRAGVDMVRIIAPKRAADIIASFSPNLATYPLAGERLNKEDVDTLLFVTKAATEVAHDKVAVVIGGGLGHSTETQKAIIEYLEQISVKAVIDADAIHAVAQRPAILKGKAFLLTPHASEFNVLTGKDISKFNDKEREEEVMEEAERLGTTILLTGKIDVVSISDGKTVARNKTGTPFMTVGGTGDTLAGIAGAILARGRAPFESGCAAAYINGKAGEIAARKYNEGLLATDLIEEIPTVLKNIKNNL